MQLLPLSEYWRAGAPTLRDDDPRDEPAALAVANARFADLDEPLVALVRDGLRVELRYARRGASGRYVALQRRGSTAEALDLLPHPEGGWFRQTWAAPVTVRPPGYPGERATATAIQFLLEPGDASSWHVVRSDELWLWQRDGPLTLRLGGSGAAPAGQPEAVTLGPDLAAGQVLQALVPGGTWQSAEPAGEIEVLVSCVVSPGFDFDDFRVQQS